MYQHVCKRCGKPVPRPGATYCSRACYNAVRQCYKICVICGQSFACPPSAATVTCSPSCSRANRQRLVAAECKDNTVAMLQGRAAAEALKPGPQNVNAKDWVLLSPDGTEHHVHNLLDWVRQNESLFDAPPKRVVDGFIKIKATALGHRTKNKSYTYKGWRLVSFET